jgi:hypothetical protein
MFSLMVELTTRWHPEKYNAPENIEDIGPMLRVMAAVGRWKIVYAMKNTSDVILLPLLD